MVACRDLEIKEKKYVDAASVLRYSWIMKTDMMKEKIALRIQIRQIQREGTARSLKEEMLALKDKLHYAILDIEQGKRNSLVTSNMGYTVAEILRKRQEIDSHDAYIDSLRDLAEEAS